MDRYLHRDNPSFSSTLLDAIYRSIDESNGGKKGGGEEELIFYRETMRKKHHNNCFKNDNNIAAAAVSVSSSCKDERKTSLKKACMIEKWIEEKELGGYENIPAVRRKSMADFDKNSRRDSNVVKPVLLNSSSSSSESSCGGGFSSSESESFYGLSSAKPSSTNYTMQRPKPIRTSVSSARPADEIGMYNNIHYNHHHQDRNYAPTQTKPSKHEAGGATLGSFVKTKSKALKIYGDLKKVKQPISPGGRLASFLNSLFTPGNAKKAKISSSSSVSGYHHEKSEQTSTCSSASSFSRSCLSKTPSSRGNNGAKRSVRFYPVSVIVDEDSRPCGHKNVYSNEESVTLMTITTKRNNPANEELKFHVMNESRRVEEVARGLLKNYQKKKQQEEFDLCNNGSNVIRTYSNHQQGEEDDEDGDDAESYASSDLFELDNLSAIGIERYREELPVYETTHLDTNRAIANGLIL